MAEVTLAGNMIQGRLKEPAVLEGKGDAERVPRDIFITLIPAMGDDEPLGLLEEHDVIIRTEPESGLSILAIAINVLPFLLLMSVGYFFLRRAQGAQQGIFSMG